MRETTPAPLPYEKRLTKLEINLQDGVPTSTRLAWTEVFRRPDGSVASQVDSPEYLDDHNGDLSQAALGDLADAQARHIETLTAAKAAHEATIAEQAAQLAERAPLQAELDAANANVQALLAQVEALASENPGPGSAAEPGLEP